MTDTVVYRDEEGRRYTRDNAGAAVYTDQRERPEGWEPPVPLDITPGCPVFPVHALPGVFAEYATALAEATQTPIDMAGGMILAAFAAAAGGRAVVTPRTGWTEPTNLYIAIAMNPAERKSAVVDAVTKPLRAAEKAVVAGSRETISAATIQKSIAEERARVAARAAAGAKDDDGSAARDAQEAAAMAEAIAVPVEPQLLADDATPEALTSLLAEQGGRVAVLSAEGGIFDMISGRYSKWPPLETYLKGHAGDTIRVNRKGRAAEYIEHPALTIGLALQPDVLRTIAEREGLRARGLLARFMFAMPQSKVGRRDVNATPVAAELEDRYGRELQALVLTLAEWTDPAVLSFTSEAHDCLVDFMAHIEPQLGPGGSLEAIKDWAGKLAGAAVRISGLLHLAGNLKTGYRQPITAETFRHAVEIAEYYLAFAIKVFAFMGADPALAGARHIVQWAGRLDDRRFTRREVHRALASYFPKAADLDEPLALLEERGWIRRVPSPPPSNGRPPSPIFDVHPDAHRQN